MTSQKADTLAMRIQTKTHATKKNRKATAIKILAKNVNVAAAPATAQKSVNAVVITARATVRIKNVGATAKIAPVKSSQKLVLTTKQIP